jgi:hypothetical protein
MELTEGEATIRSCVQVAITLHPAVPVRETRAACESKKKTSNMLRVEAGRLW